MKIFERGPAVLFSRVWNRFEFDSPLSARLLDNGYSAMWQLRLCTFEAEAGEN
jgi:hypothetical protein